MALTGPRLQWNEIKAGLAIGSRDLVDKLSLRTVLSHSWEAGGVYPTLLGYALGAVATLFVVGASHWALRFIPAALCGFLFMQTLLIMENPSFAILLVFAAMVGVGCTFVQVLTWKQAFASVALRRKLNSKAKSTKVDKED